MQFSEYQTAIFDFVKAGVGSAIVEAVAGSGKTTTIVEAVKLINPRESVLMLAFNKTIAEELTTRIGNRQNIICKTFHSVGFSAYRNANPKVKMDGNKLNRLIDDLVYNSDLSKEERDGVPFIAKIVRLGKSAGLGTKIAGNVQENWADLIEHHDVGGFANDVDLTCVIPICMEILRRSNLTKVSVDFDDMIYMPVQQDLKFPKYDWIFVDEAQDVSETQRAMLKAMMKSTSRLIAVGDPKQAIYGFRGADSESLTNLSNDFNCVKLPLSISYRCAKQIVAEAQKWVTHIQSSPTAIEGSVIRKDKYTEKDFAPSDAIICRNVAPLLTMAYGLISRGVPVNMLGRDIGAGLSKLVKTLKPKDLAELDSKLEIWQQNEIAKLAGRKDNEAKIESINDRVECLRLFIDQADSDMTIAAFLNKVESFFSDEPNGNITLSSVHKFKGKEVSTCFILDEHRLMPKWVKRNWQIEQERNICYVAITRAKENLYFIAGNSWSNK